MTSSARLLIFFSRLAFSGDAWTYLPIRCFSRYSTETTSSWLIAIRNRVLKTARSQKQPEPFVHCRDRGRKRVEL